MDGINPILRDTPFGDGSPDRRGARAFRAMRDTVFAVTIGLTGLAVLSPLSGLAAARNVKAEPRTAATRGRYPCRSRRSLAASDEAQYGDESHVVGGIDRAFRARLNAHTIRPAEEISNMRSETPRLQPSCTF